MGFVTSDDATVRFGPIDWVARSKDELVQELINRGIVSDDKLASQYTKNELIELLKIDERENELIPLLKMDERDKPEKITQQFDVSENWFLKEQRLQVAGESIHFKFAHVKYIGPGGHEPTIVLTVEFDPYGESLPSLPGEIMFFVHRQRHDGIPSLPPSWMNDSGTEATTVHGLYGEIFTIYTHEFRTPEQSSVPASNLTVTVDCDTCNGFGKIMMNIDVTTFSDPVPVYKNIEQRCGRCSGTGKARL